MATNNSWNNTVSAASVTLNGGAANIGTDNAANAISIGVGTTARTIGIGNSAAAHVVTIGSTTGAASLALKTGTADFTLASATGTIMSALDTGEITYPLQCAFLAYLGSADLNKTGTGTAFTLGSATALTEVFDQNSDFNTNGTFTAPITGRYQLNTTATVIGCTIASTIALSLITSNRTYTGGDGRIAGSTIMVCECVVLADMDAADTATMTIATAGEASDTDDISGTNLANVFSGFLAA